MAEQTEVKNQVAVKGQEVKQEDKKLCPFLTLPVMVSKLGMVNGKPTQVPEAQLKINLCIKTNCALFNNENKKCGLIKG